MNDKEEFLCTPENAIYRFIAGTFHQDWSLRYGNWRDALGPWKNTSPDWIRALRAAIHEILAGADKENPESKSFRFRHFVLSETGEDFFKAIGEESLDSWLKAVDEILALFLSERTD